MCYRNSSSKTKKELEARYEAEFAEPDEYEVSYHTAASDAPKWAIIPQESPEKIEMYAWGLIPQWVKDEKQAIEIQFGNANAKCETIFEKPSFRESIIQSRCLVVSTGFYEFKEIKKKKYPYFIRLAESEIFSLAGITSTWVDKSTGELFNTFSILTKEADAFMADIHNVKKRMPVILPKAIERKWLEPDLSRSDIRSFFGAFELDYLAHTVSPLITSRTQNPNVPEVQSMYKY